MPPRRALPDKDHVTRFVPKNKQRRDPETDAFLGLAPASFMLRPEDDGGLSVTWIEHFGALGVASKQAAAIAYRGSLKSKKLGSEGVFATANVTAIGSAATSFKKEVRVVHDPVPGNPGHAQVRHFTDDDLGLLDHLASEIFTDVDFVKDLNLPPR